MKVLWIADFSIKHNYGGAQRSDDIIIKKGKLLGVDITEFNYDSDAALLNYSYDFVISANLEVIYRNNPNIIDFLHSSAKHVRLEHDMNRYLPQFDRVRLFNCFKTFFLSNFHYEAFIRNYGNIFNNVEIVYDPIDGRQFFNFYKKREDKILYVGFMHELKGTLEFFDFVAGSPEKQFVIAGWGSRLFNHLAESFDNVSYLGMVKHDDMSNLFNSYSSLFYTPRIEEPFCRSVGEASLCGINMIINDKIGCLHEIERVGISAFKDGCQNAADIFWSKLC